MFSHRGHGGLGKVLILVKPPISIWQSLAIRHFRIFFSPFSLLPLETYFRAAKQCGAKGRKANGGIVMLIS
jgi:hypothetical protein